jgi:hypothetical protein
MADEFCGWAIISWANLKSPQSTKPRKKPVVSFAFLADRSAASSRFQSPNGLYFQKTKTYRKSETVVRQV